MGVYLPFTPRLPSTYQEVEYIESSGTQYIDTGVKPTNKTKVVNKGFLGNASVFYGVGRQSYYQSICLLTDGTNYGGRCRSSSSANSTVTSTIPWGTDVHIFEISQGGGFYIDGTKIGTFTSYTYTESYNIYVFGWSNRGTFIDGGIARLYYMEIYEDGTLIRNFIPCYRKSDTVIGLYDLVNNQFYTNSGTGTFSKGADVTAIPLKNAYIGEYNTPPSAYQKVEWIQSSGTQRVEIGNLFKTSYKITIDFQMTATGGDQILVGVREIVSGTSYRYGINAYSSNFKVISGGSSWNNTKSEDTNRHTITINKTTATADGTNYSCSYVDHTYNMGIYVFDYNILSGSSNFPSKNKLYKLDVYDENGNHIHDVVPCYRKSDNVIGLYDLVNDQFYTNSGTGTFTKGPDVN